MRHINTSERYGNMEIVTIQDYQELNPDGRFEIDYNDEIREYLSDEPGDFEIIAVPDYTEEIEGYYDGDLETDFPDALDRMEFARSFYEQMQENNKLYAIESALAETREREWREAQQSKMSSNADPERGQVLIIVAILLAIVAVVLL